MTSQTTSSGCFLFEVYGHWSIRLQLFFVYVVETFLVVKPLNTKIHFEVQDAPMVLALGV